MSRPQKGLVAEAIRLLPDLLRLLASLAKDKTLDRGVRWRVFALLGYLAMPFDLVPDFIPVLGYADDVLAVAWVLRSVARRVGMPELRRHWSGTEDGFTVLIRLTGAR